MWYDIADNRAYRFVIEEYKMRAYHFFMKFMRSFYFGFRCAWLIIFTLGAILAAMVFVMMR